MDQARVIDRRLAAAGKPPAEISTGL